jgi:hypothetical protein
MGKVPIIARIGFLVFCLIVAALLLTHEITVIQSSSAFIIGLLAFGIIRRKEKTNKTE